MTAAFYLAPDPSGADDTTALQAALDATPDSGCLVFPCPATYVLTKPLSVYNRVLTLRSFGRAGGTGPGHRGTEFQWKGPLGAVGVLDVNYSRVTLENLALSLDVGTTPPAAGISLDMYPDPRPRTQPNTTRCRILGCDITLPSAKTCLANGTPDPTTGVVVPYAVDGIAVSKISRINCEYMLVRDTTIAAVGTAAGAGSCVGFHNYGSANAKGNTCELCSVSWCKTGFQYDWGSGNVLECTGTGNGCFVRTNNTEPVLIARCDVEQTAIAVATVGQNSPVMIDGNRFIFLTVPTPNGGACFDFKGEFTFLRNNRLACAKPNPTGTPPNYAPQFAVQYLGSSPIQKIYREGNLFSYITTNDGWMGRLLGPLELERNN